MQNWSLEYSRKASSNLRKMHPRDAKNINQELEDALMDPLHSSKHLSGGLRGLRSIRKGNVRAIIVLLEDESVLFVARIEYRGNSY